MSTLGQADVTEVRAIVHKHFPDYWPAADPGPGCRPAQYGTAVTG